MGATSNSPWRRGLIVGAIALASASAGWVLGESSHDDPEHASTRGIVADISITPRVPEARMPGFSESFDERAPFTHVVADGEAISGPGTWCEAADEAARVLDLALLERKLTEGTETERHAALTGALQSESDVPPRLLQQTYVTDLSESVRLLAFKAYVDSISDDRGEVRNTLESGVYDMSAAVQAEAKRRLAELERFELMLAEVPPQGS